MIENASRGAPPTLGETQPPSVSYVSTSSVDKNPRYSGTDYSGTI